MLKRRRLCRSAGIGQVTLPTHLSLNVVEEEVLLTSSGKVSPPTQQAWATMRSLVGLAVTM